MKHLKPLRILTPIAIALLAGSMLGSPAAQADAVAYLVNVTVRPGYGFASADDALDYGFNVCNKIGSGLSFSELTANTKSDFNTTDDYQVSYLISQAVNELCPTQIWRLRHSAANYDPGGSQ
jgi:hypothetical protein